ncbi:MAG: hypothetical protein ACOX6U_11275 [Oscillospiraceae bacterium]|jgi:hypothetical protein
MRAPKQKPSPDKTTQRKASARQNKSGNKGFGSLIHPQRDSGNNHPPTRTANTSTRFQNRFIAVLLSSFVAQNTPLLSNFGGLLVKKDSTTCEETAESPAFWRQPLLFCPANKDTVSFKQRPYFPQTEPL